jgi:hypothetical protein
MALAQPMPHLPETTLAGPAHGAACVSAQATTWYDLIDMAWAEKGSSSPAGGSKTDMAFFRKN